MPTDRRWRSISSEFALRREDKPPTLQNTVPYSNKKSSVCLWGAHSTGPPRKLWRKSLTERTISASSRCVLGLVRTIKGLSHLTLSVSDILRRESRLSFALKAAVSKEKAITQRDIAINQIASGSGEVG
jgi:hypothetical protein